MSESLFPKTWHHRLLLKSGFWVLAFMLAIVQAWKNRYLIWTDGVSYLDIADAYLRADWSAALNACWSPLYSWILGVFLFVTKPSPFLELPVVKVVNFILYVLALIAFDFFLEQLITYSSVVTQRRTSQNSRLKKPKWVWISLGYTIFIWSSIEWILVHRDTPDMMVAGLFYLASAMVLRIAVDPIGWSNYLILGIVLGVGYLAKSSMLPLGFIFLLSAFHVGNQLNLKRASLRVAISALVMLLIAAPFITAISLQKGRLTFGDAGKLNYAWYISPKTPDQFWQGRPDGSGIPIHPTRQIHVNPEIQEFATPISGAYPPWYDPSYWNEGLKPSFNLKKQLLFAFRNLIFCWKIFIGFLFFGCLILASINRRGFSGLFSQLILHWRMLLPSVFGLASFLLLTDISVDKEPWIMIQTRYIAPFIVVLFSGVFLSFDPYNTKFTNKVLVHLILASVILTNINLALDPTKLQVKGGDITGAYAEHTHWQIADHLGKLGIQPGDRVALLGQSEFYWARLAKVKIVASLNPKFWSSDEMHKSSALQTIKNIGARAIIQPPSPPWLPSPYATPTGDWQKLGDTDGYIHIFKE